MFLTPLSYAQECDTFMYYTPSCTLQNWFLSKHVRGSSQVKRNKSTQKVISVILLSCFFLSKASLPPGDIYQCLKMFWIVTARGRLWSLMSSGHALLNVLQTHSTVPTTETSLPKPTGLCREAPLERAIRRPVQVLGNVAFNSAP